MKRSLALLLFFIVTMHLQSQDTNFGAKAGLNLSIVSGDVSDGVNPRLAYHVGGFAHVQLSDKFSLNPELLYFSIGNTFTFDFNGLRNFNPDPIIENSSFKSVTRANFLAVPVNFRFNFTDSFGLDFGPQVSFLINSVDKLKQGNNIGDVPERTSRSGDFRPDYGANLGVTFSPNEKLNFQLRYYQGLKNLSFFRDDRSFNVALQFAVGYVLF